MKEQWLALGMAVALTAAGVGCGSTNAAVTTDVQAYLQRTKQWAPVEAETAQTLERILRTQFVDEAEVRRQIAASRPHVEAQLEQARGYVPRSAPVAGIHARYAQGWEELLRGYDAIESGFASGDYTRLARGREAMAAWRQTMIDVAAELRQLIDRYGVDPASAVES